MNRNSTGRYVEAEARGQRHDAFIPAPLPPEPTLRWDGRLVTLLAEAADALGRLSGAAKSLQQEDADAILRAYIRREAVLSSYIEGFQSSLENLLLLELKQNPGVPLEDAREVARCVEAIEQGWERIENGSAHISNELLLNLHAILLRDKQRLMPGKFRRDPVWIGSSITGEIRYVPPPWTEVEPCMQELQHFLEDSDGQMPALARAGLAHVQFETIHPFLDGNGRVGRMLINLMLGEPLLYLSQHFWHNQRDYYDLLNQVRLTGDWEAWMEFFLEGVRDTAKFAALMVEDVSGTFRDDEDLIADKAGRRTASVQKLHDVLKEYPIVSVANAAEMAGITYPTAADGLEWLKGRAMVHEASDDARGRLFVYTRHLNILSEGAE